MDKAPFKSSYDVVVIGAGVGGLTAASLLSKAGLSVCVVEKEPHPGGYLAGFRRKHFRFDTAIHWLNQYYPGGMICNVFDSLGPDYPKAIPQKRIRLYRGDDYEYLLTNKPDDLKEQWQREFPEDTAGIEKFFKDAKRLGRSFKDFGHIFRSEETMTPWKALMNKRNLLKFGLPFIKHLRYSGEEGIKKGLNKYFKAEKLHRVFSADTEILGCLVPIGWAYEGDYQSPPHGGGQVIAEWLEHIINYYNQETHYQCAVTKINVENGVAEGVTLTQHKQEISIAAEFVIAACDLRLLYNKLLPQEAVPEKIKAKLAAAEVYSSSVTLSIALDCTAEALGMNEELVHISSHKIAREEHNNGNPAHAELCIIAPSFRDKSLAPKGNGTLVVYMPAFMDFENSWKTEKDAAGNPIRGEEYKKLKDEIAQVLLERVERLVIPNLRKHILFYDVATPITHWRYTGNEGGTMMGAKPGRANMQNKVARYHTPVKNLLVGGHWAELGGGVPIAAKAGANAALIVLAKKKPKTFQALVAFFDGKMKLQDFEDGETFLPYEGTYVQALTPAQKLALREEKVVGG